MVLPSYSTSFFSKTPLFQGQWLVLLAFPSLYLKSYITRFKRHLKHYSCKNAIIASIIVLLTDFRRQFLNKCQQTLLLVCNKYIQIQFHFPYSFSNHFQNFTSQLCNLCFLTLSFHSISLASTIQIYLFFGQINELWVTNLSG